MDKKSLFEILLMMFFIVIIVLILVGMVFGPFGYTTASLTLSGGACVLCLVGLMFLFVIWRKN